MGFWCRGLREESEESEPVRRTCLLFGGSREVGKAENITINSVVNIEAIFRE